MRLRSALLVGLLVLAMAFPAFAAAEAPASFPDVPPGHWAYDAVNKLLKAGLMIGYPDKTFGGDKPITRYEAALVIARYLGTFPADQLSQDQKASLDQLRQEFQGEFRAIGDRLGVLESKLGASQGNSEVTPQELAAIGQRLKTLEASVAGLKTDVDGMKTDVSTLKQQMQKANAEIEALKSRPQGADNVESLENDLRVLKAQVEKQNKQMTWVYIIGALIGVLAAVK
ncbi:MAG: S-layer homology domain-containing protein [Syntrophothermus sp.]